MKKSYLFLATTAGLATLTFAVGVSSKKTAHPTNAARPAQTASSGIPTISGKSIAPDSNVRVLSVNPSAVEQLLTEHVFDKGTVSPIKQKLMDLETRMRAAMARGENVSGLRNEMDVLSREMNPTKVPIKGPVAKNLLDQRPRSSLVNPFLTATSPAAHTSRPIATTLLHSHIYELERQADAVHRAGGDLTKIKAQLDELYAQILPPAPPEELKADVSGEAYPVAVAQNSNTLLRSTPAGSSPIMSESAKPFWQAADPVGSQIEFLNKQAAAIAKNGGDVQEIKARINALYDKLPGYACMVNGAIRPNATPDKTPNFGTQNPDRNSALEPIDCPFDPHGSEINTLIRQKKEREISGADVSDIDRELVELSHNGRQGTLDDNGGVLFYSTHPHVFIPDNNVNGVKDSIFVSNIGSSIQTIEVTIDTLTHTFDGDLAIYLISPSAIQRALSLHHGGSANDYITTIFSDAAATAISAGVPPFTGTFRPDSTLSAFYGANPNGWWKLWVVDNANADTGSIHQWHLQIRAPLPGDSCANAIPLTVPAQVFGNTCYDQNNYDYACPYTGSLSRDVVYSYASPVNQRVTFSLCRSYYDTKLYIYDGVCSGIPIACNDDADVCSGAIEPWRSSLPCVPLQAGHTYYIVVDGFSGACGNYVLEAGVCPACSTVCHEGDDLECLEVFDSTNAFLDCDGGCNDPFYGGTASYGTITCGDTVCGRSFTYTYGELQFRDTDWYRFTISEGKNVTLSATADFPFTLYIMDTNCASLTVYATLAFAPACSTGSVTANCLQAGTYIAWIGPVDFFGIPNPLGYRLWLSCTPCPQGSICSYPYEFSDDTTYIAHTTCGYSDDYHATCLDGWDDGEDAIYKWHITQTGDYTIWLDPHGTTWTGIVLDSVCPPRASGCLATDVDGGLGAPHGIVCQHLTAGTYYIMVDTWPEPFCIPAYDLQVGRCYSCVTCRENDFVECAEATDSTNNLTDCDGACNDADGIHRFESIASGDTICGRAFTYVAQNSIFRDTDWYRFILAAPDTIRMKAWGEFPLALYLVWLGGGSCDSLTVVATALADPCDTAAFVYVATSPGTYVMFVAPQIFDGIPLPVDYRATMRLSAPQAGLTCASPEIIVGEDTLIHQRTCGFANNYQNTCLDNWDGGEDKIYRWTVLQEGDYTIWMDPGTTTWTGIVLDDHCPPDNSGCIAASIAFGASPHGILCQHLTPGDYYIMVDTNPSPFCIPNYTLYLRRCCVSCQEGDIAECTEADDSTNAGDDCNGGCNNETSGGINSFGEISCGETICGRSFTYPYGGFDYRDTDWYLFTVAQRESVWVTCTADFPLQVLILDTLTGCSNPTVHAFATAEPCQPAIAGACLEAGLYVMWIGPSVQTDVVVPGEYRATLHCSPCMTQGQDCSIPVYVAGDTTLFNQTTCGMLNDYQGGCLFDWSNGEDIIYHWTVSQEGDYTIWLNTLGNMFMGLALDDECPPDTTCIAFSVGWSDGYAHGIARQHLTPGTYYIMVDDWPDPDCIAQYDLILRHAETPPNDSCANAIILTIPDTVAGTTINATADDFPDCFSDNTPGVWYRVTGTGHVLTVSLCGSSEYWDSRLDVFTCGCTNLHCAAQNDDYCESHAQVSWCSRAGEDYWILVNGFGGSIGDFQLVLSDSGIACGDPARCPCWDDTLTAPGTISGSTTGAGDDCSLRGSADYEVRVVIPDSGRWKFSLCGSSFDTYLYLGTDCCTQDVGYEDDATCNGQFTLSSVLCAHLPVAGIYYVTIEGFNVSHSGDFTLTVTPDAGAPPASVAGLTATTTYCDSIVVSWNAVPTAEYYYVIYDTNYAIYVAAPTTNTVFTNLNVGSHSFTIHGYNECGYGPPSAAVFGTRRSGPPQVTGVSATDSSCAFVDVSWADISDESGYRVYRDVVQVGPDLAANSVFFHDTTVLAGTAHSYSVAAFNVYCEGAMSAPDSGRRRTSPFQATGITASDTICDFVRIAWPDVASEIGYMVLRNGAAITSALPANTVIYDDATAAVGLRYTYAVKALGAFCDALPSAADSGGRPPFPAQVTGTIASDTLCDRVIILWNDLSNETAYRVARNGSNLGSLLSANTTTYTDSTAVPGTRYAYAVQGILGFCGGAYSVADSGLRIIASPPVISCAASDNRCDSVVVTWSDVANESGYRVLRDGSNISGNLPANTTRYADGAAVANVTYSYAVVSFTLGCAAPPSGTDQGTRLAPLPAATGVAASDTACAGVTVRWNNNTSGEDSFQVQRDGVRIGKTVANDTIYLDATAVPWTTYAYRVVAFNACGAGMFSVTDQGTRWSVPPSVSNVVASDAACGNTVLTWSAAAVPCQYRITRDSVIIGNLTSGVTSFQDSTCLPGSHNYCVQAYNNCGSSAPVCDQGTCRRPPDQSPVLQFADTCTAARLCWSNVLNEDGYRVYRNSVPLDSTGLNDTCLTIVTPPGVLTCYAVQAFNVCGSGPTSLQLCVTVPRTPPAVTGVAASQNRCDSVIVSWQDVTGEDQYQILRNGAVVGTAPQNAQRFADMPSVGTIFYYVVRAHNACGLGQNSDSVAGQRLPAPHSPTLVNASDSLCAQVLVSWSGQSGTVDSLKIYRDGTLAGRQPATATNWTDSPVGGAHLYTVRAFSSLCGEAVFVAQDSGTARTAPSAPLSLNFVTPAICDTIRLSWAPSIGEAAGYVILRDSVIVDTTANTFYRDHNVNNAHDHIYTVRAYNRACGLSAAAGPVVGSMLPLASPHTDFPDTVDCDVEYTAIFSHCVGVTSDTLRISINNGPFTYLGRNVPVRDTLVFSLPSNLVQQEFTPNCHVQVISRRAGRTDTLTSPAFTIRCATGAAGETVNEIPKDFFLDQNYPNPFNPTTTIRFGMPRAAELTMDVFDVTGRRVTTLLSGTFAQGIHSITWDCSACPSGMYLIRMQTDDRVFMHKMVLMK